MGGPGSGPPPTYTIDDAERIVSLMEVARVPLIQASAQLNIPLASAHDCIRRHQDTHGERYRMAQEALADEYAHGALSAVEDGVRLVLDEGVDAKRANAVASATRNLSERRAWAAKMLAPDRYGDRVTHGGTIRHEAVVLLPQLQQLTPPAAASEDAPGALPRASARLLGDGGSEGDAGDAR